MSKQNINLGNALNDGTGDVLRVGGEKINSNFTELYNALGGESGAPLSIVSGLRAGSGIVLSSKTGDVLVTAQPATRNDPGVVKIGTGLNITDGVVSAPIYTLPVADGNILGGIKVGARLSIDPDGVLSADPGAYTLPIAQAGVLGGVKVGTGLSINPTTGVLSSAITQYTLPTAAAEILGGVKVGSRLTIDNGVLSADLQISNVTALNNGDYSLALDTNGRIGYPGNGVYQQFNMLSILPNTDTVIYTTNGEYIRAIKIFALIEKFTNGYESQACEIIATIDQSSNEIYVSVYGITYTGAAPIATFDGQYTLIDGDFKITARPVSTNPIENVNIRVQITELNGTD